MIVRNVLFIVLIKLYIYHRRRMKRRRKTTRKRRKTNKNKMQIKKGSVHVIYEY